MHRRRVPHPMHRLVTATQPARGHDPNPADRLDPTTRSNPTMSNPTWHPPPTARAWHWLRTWLLLCAVALLASGCGGGPSGASAPRILEHPADRTVRPGESASFSVVAEGAPPLTYRWQRDGVDIAGADGATYVMPAATAADAGARLRVVVRGPKGETVSEAATLRVEGAAPQIVALLRLGVVSPAQPLVVTVKLAGNPPFQYQWLRNGVPIEGATGTTSESTIAIGPLPLTLADDGVRIAAVIANADGAIRAPDAVISVIGPRKVAAGPAHTLATGADGTLWAWGSNAFGQLGDGGTASRTAAMAAGVSGVIATAAGDQHSLALRADGTVWAWGRNADGALGDGSTTDRGVPQRVPGLDGVVSIAAAGGRSFAVRADGTVWAWGENSTGALGIGTLTNTSTPTQVGVGSAGFGGIIRVAAGQAHTLALRVDGKVFQFGAVLPTTPATTGPQVRPSIVDELTNVSMISAGDQLSIALDVNGSVWAWGQNDRGQLGLPNTSRRAVPTLVAQQFDGQPMPPVLRVDAGANFVLARAVDGSMLAWGAGDSGQLGTGDLADRALPTRVVAFARPVRTIAAGARHGVAELVDGTLTAWGSNAAGQLGLAPAGGVVPTPTPIPALDLD